MTALLTAKLSVREIAVSSREAFSWAFSEVRLQASALDLGLDKRRRELPMNGKRSSSINPVSPVSDDLDSGNTLKHALLPNRPLFPSSPASALRQLSSGHLQPLFFLWKRLKDKHHRREQQQAERKVQPVDHLPPGRESGVSQDGRDTEL
jgi:hypothetical protein